MSETIPEAVPATRRRVLAVAGLLFNVGAVSFFFRIR